MARPNLIVVSGPPGAGKTTLAHALAAAIPCPAICRDEIKEGMAHASLGFKPGPDDPLTQRTFTTFFAVLDVLLESGVTLVAEAAFQGHVWRPELERLSARANLRLICCSVTPQVARERCLRRLTEPAEARAAHADQSLFEADHEGGQASVFVPLSLNVPTLPVDTTENYRPGFGEVVAFARAHRS